MMSSLNFFFHRCTNF
uniref:Uncharacterized protein n=1 Tax=Anguilla anguilla TaxID=7936 RepID=A0A0E9PRS0_ANGAN